MPDLCEDGCGWNKGLELEYYLNNVKTVGVQEAIVRSRANARSYRDEKAGRKTAWSMELTSDGLDMELADGTMLMEVVTVNPFTGSRAHTVDDEVRETAKKEGPTLKKAVELAREGAPFIIFPEHHLTENGFVVKHLTVWQQDEHNKRMYHGHRVSFEKNVSIDEARSALKQKSILDKGLSYHQGDIKEAFVLSAHKPETTIKSLKDTLVSSVEKIYEPKLHIQDALEHIVDEVVVTVQRVSPETQRVVEDVVSYVRSHTPHEKQDDGGNKKIYENERSEEQPSVFQRLFEGDSGKKALETLSTPPKNPDKKIDLVFAWQTLARDTLGISLETAVVLEKEVEKTWEVGAEKRDQILVAVDSGVAVGGALLLLDTLTTLDFDSLPDIALPDQDTVVVEVLQEVEGKQLVRSDAIISIVDNIFEEVQIESLTIGENYETEVAEEEEAQPVVDEVVVSWIKEFISSLDQQAPEQAVVTIEEEQALVIHKLEFLSEIFKEFVDEKRANAITFIAVDVFDAQKKHRNSEIYGTAEFERQTVREFSFAVIIFMIVQFASYHQKLVSLKEAFVDMGRCMKNPDKSTSVADQVHEIIKTKLTEGLVSKEPTQWILLSIIWYLAMIREQGMYTTLGSQAQQIATDDTGTSIKPRKKTKKTIMYRGYPFDSQGVIFAFSS